jgi:hypothetical protein
MNDPQQTTIDLLVSKGYTLHRSCCWPVYHNQETGVYIRVAYDGRQMGAGYDKP